MTAIRVAVVGIGKIARDQHLPAIAADPRFELAATVERAAPPSATNFTSVDALLAAGLSLDAVAVTTPPGPRYAIARQCLEAGLHVLLEKPPTATLAEIENLRELAVAGARTLFTTWHAQHNGAVSAAAALLNGRTVERMDIVWHEDVHKWHPGQAWIWRGGGFGVFDPGINALSIATRIFPGPLFVKAAELTFPDGADTPIAAQVTFTSPGSSGPLGASFDWRRPAGEEWMIAIETSDGRKLVLAEGGARLTVDGAEQPTQGIGEYPDLYRRFAELITACQSEVDIAPLRLVADCFLVGSRRGAPAVTGP